MNNNNNLKYPGTKGFVMVELFFQKAAQAFLPADALYDRIEKDNKYRPVYRLAYHDSLLGSFGLNG